MQIKRRGSFVTVSGEIDLKELKQLFPTGSKTTLVDRLKEVKGSSQQSHFTQDDRSDVARAIRRGMIALHIQKDQTGIGVQIATSYDDMRAVLARTKSCLRDYPLENYLADEGALYLVFSSNQGPAGYMRFYVGSHNMGEQVLFEDRILLGDKRKVSTTEYKAAAILFLDELGLSDETLVYASVVAREDLPFVTPSLRKLGSTLFKRRYDAPFYFAGKLEEPPRFVRADYLLGKDL